MVEPDLDVEVPRVLPLPQARPRRAERGEALNELQYAQRLWGESPRLTATIALVQNRLGNLRLGIN
ncbi:MAG: hypothetical protein DYH06_17820, partial [Acidobacteria bacterium ACB2]|nr:hypothetical protein [Acidobacteria bacterium ACB2]